MMCVTPCAPARALLRKHTLRWCAAVFFRHQLASVVYLSWSWLPSTALVPQLGFTIPGPFRNFAFCRRARSGLNLKCYKGEAWAIPKEEGHPRHHSNHLGLPTKRARSRPHIAFQAHKNNNTPKTHVWLLGAESSSIGDRVMLSGVLSVNNCS